MKDGWKYICLEGEPWLLFNLADDPFEGQNLAHNSIYAGQRRRYDTPMILRRGHSPIANAYHLGVYEHSVARSLKACSIVSPTARAMPCVYGPRHCRFGAGATSGCGGG